MLNKTWEECAAIATVIGVLFASFGVCVSSVVYYRAERLTRDGQAVAFYVQYDSLATDASDDLRITLAESIWNLEHGDVAWDATVRRMLNDTIMRRHAITVRCDTFDPAFLAWSTRSFCLW